MKNSLVHSFLYRSRLYATVAESAVIGSAIVLAIVVTIVVTAVTGSLLFATAAYADPPDAAESDKSAQVRPAAPSDAIPLPASEAIMQNEFLRNALSRSHSGLQVIRGPQGELSVDLQGRFQSVTTARVDADGEIETTCIENHASLEHFLAAHPGSDESDYREAVFGEADAGEAGNED